MGKVYHILLIDDEQSDIDLIETELRKLDIQVQIDIIQKEKQLIYRLDNNPPDLVISDNNLPTLTGTDALQIVQDRHPQLPFILIAGSIGEEKAINIMLQGASDYALKQNLDRLGPAILRELVNYEDHKKQSRRLEKTRSQYENLVGSINGIVWEADAKTLEFLYVSPQSKQLLGYSPEEWLGEPNFWQQHIHPDDRRETIHFCHHKTQQGEDHSFEYRIFDANDEVVWLRDYVTVDTQNGKPNRLCGFMVDISREKKAERQRDKAYEIANIGHWELDLTSEELYWSNAVKKLHEVNSDYEPTLDTAFAFYKKDEHRQKIAAAVENAIQTRESFEVELKIITAKDNEKWVRVVGETEFRNGACKRIYGSTQDISERKEAEQKLQESLELYEYATQATENIIYDWDLTEDILYWDDSFHDKFIYDIEEGSYSIDNWAQNVHPEDRPEAQKSLNDLLHSSKSKWEQEYRFKKQDGTYAAVFERGFIIRDQHGEAIRMIGSLQDITDRKEYEEELEQLSLVASKTTDLIIMTDPQEKITWVNQAFVELTEYSFEESMGENPGDLLQGPGTDPETVNRLAKAIQNRHSIQEIILNYSKTGQPYWLDLTIDPIFDEEDNCEGFIAIEKEVTQQVERQKELKESLDRYEIVSKATSDTIWDLDLETDTIDYSQNIYNVFGYELQQVDEIGEWWRDKIHLDDRPEVLETIDQALRSSSERFQMEYRFQAADGTYKYINDRAFIVEDHDGNSIRIIGAMRDISDQKEAEHKMKEAFQERERILDRINEAFFAIDRNWNVTYWNKQAEEVIGEKRADVLGENLWETFPAAKERKFFKEYKRAFQEQVPVQFEEYYPPLNRWLELNAYPSEEGLSIFFRDITERKEAEQSLRDLYQKNRLVLESTDEGIYGIDIEGCCTFINKAAANMLGLQSEECIGKNMHELIHNQHINGDPYPESECPIFISKNKHESCRVTDEVFWRADGSCFNVEYTSNPMIEDGEIKGAVVAFSDITERKQREQELQESLKEKETLLQEIHHRVKNNLAVVSGMMQMQVFEEEDENVKQKLSDGINRIQTMGGIHELLYQSESFSRVDADKNVRKLVTDVVNTFQINLDLDIEFNLQKISLNINQAIPFSLIINEVITNVMKHAFVDRNQGILSVSLAEKDNVISINIMDNGQGLPDNFENKPKYNSLGLQLINTLSTQLNGKYTYESLDEGTLFTFAFEKADVKGVGNARLN